MSLSSTRILFFIPENNVETNGVYASQVLGLARYCASQGAQCLIFQHGEGGEQPDDFKGGVGFINDILPRYYRPSYMDTRFYRKLTRRYSAKLVDFHPTHIYCRMFQTCRAADELVLKTGAKLVYSMRGADEAEAYGRGTLRDRIRAWCAACGVKRAVAKCDHLNTVSHSFAQWIEARYGRESSVLPCCVDDSLFVRRDETGQSDVKTVVYSGGLWAWQKIDTIIGLMRKMSEADPTMYFRFLTQDMDTLKQKCDMIGLDSARWSGKACKPFEVAGELAKADCGIIIRDDNLVNQVASPIKIGEYLAAGLGIIASPFIGDIGRELASEDFACLVDSDTPVERIVSFVKGLTVEKRKHAVAWVRKHLTYDGNNDTILGIFA